MILVLRGARLSRREGDVGVDKVVEISRRVSDEPRVGNITLGLRDIRFEASERECRQRKRRQWRNSQRRENSKMIRWRNRGVIANRRYRRGGSSNDKITIRNAGIFNSNWLKNRRLCYVTRLNIC